MQTFPQRVDARTRTDSVRLADLRRVIPEHCTRPSAMRSWAALFRALTLAALLTVLISWVQLSPDWGLLWQVPVLVSLWVLQGWVLLGLFVIGHECGHGSFSRHRWVNTLVGYLCFSPLSNGFHTWRVTHDHHHAHTQRRGEEVDWASHLRTKEELKATSWTRNPIVRLGYALPFGIFFWITVNTFRRGLTVRRQIGEAKWAREGRRVITSNLVMLATVFAIYAALIGFFDLWTMLKFYGIPGFVTTVTGSLIITFQHASEHTLLYSEKGWTPLRGQVVSTFDVRFPRWIEWLWCDINIHVPHHIDTRVPWYRLRTAGAAIREHYPEYYQEQRFTLRHLTWFTTTPVLRKVPEFGYYVMEIPRPSRWTRKPIRWQTNPQAQG